MEEIKYTIYKLIDPISNDIRYIGLTFNTLKQRLGSHLGETGKSHKCNWIKKLKSQGLRPIIESIEDNISSYDECCLREIYYINYYKDICNLTNSASGGNKNKKMSDETRKKMSDAQKERYKTFKLVLTEETKKVLSKKSKERFQKEEERDKLRISNKRYEDSKTEEQKLNDILVQQTSKSVFQYDKDMNFVCEYPSIKYAAKKNGIACSNISKCCKHKVVMVGGFVWRFEGDLEPPVYKSGGIVIKYDLDNNFIEEYKNANVAGKENNINGSHVSRCCKKVAKSAGGFIWRYKNDNDI